MDNIDINEMTCDSCNINLEQEPTKKATTIDYKAVMEDYLDVND